jgi:hypothetical protein
MSTGPRIAFNRPLEAAAFATALPFAATEAMIAAFAEGVVAGNAASTPKVNALPGAERFNAPSTNVVISSVRSLRPRERRCLTASREISSSEAIRSMDSSSR